MEKNIPFVGLHSVTLSYSSLIRTHHQVMSCAAEFFRPPEGMNDKLSAYGNAIVSKWVPQQALLEHPVRVLLQTH